MPTPATPESDLTATAPPEGGTGPAPAAGPISDPTPDQTSADHPTRAGESKLAAKRFLDEQKPLAGGYLRLAIAMQLANGGLLIAQAWVLAYVVNAFVFGGAGRADLAPWMLPLLGLFALRALLNWGAEQTAFRAAAGVKRSLRDRVYRHIQAAGPSWMAGQRSGALAEDLTKGIEALEAYFARYLPAMTVTMLLPVAILVVVAPIDWLSSLIMALVAPLIPLFMILIGTRVEAINQHQWKALARMGAHFLDVIQGLTTLKLFNASRREAKIIAEISEDYRRRTMEVLRVAFLSSAVLEFFATVGIAIIAVFIGFRLYQLELPLPDLMAPPEIGFLSGFFILLLAPEFFLPLRNLGTHYHGRLEAIAAAERIADILATPLPERPAPGRRLPASSPLAVAFQEVHFAYEEGRPALQGASFRLNPGERVALVGPSGAGKTTIASLLLGFSMPDAGCILIDGEDLATLDLDDWRQRLAWLPQRPRLFQGSLLENIRLGRPEASLEEVQEAARRARAAEFIDQLPAGYDTQIGEQGIGLSGGQIQRIALARAFVRDARLVILDEATASLDPANEALVQAGIDELARDRALLIIAHRLITVRHADRILVIVDGRIAEQGTHDQLIALRGHYARMAQGQFAGGAQVDSSARAFDTATGSGAPA
ncbi:ATP-binding/permease protein CydD [Thiorhodovibrio winogradskyi]|uniref:ATP-binding/permease protein CydD n=1 Tax=Thiorhodovibrio winogradskyi TaxID=77007 RepID=A0ABZ0SC15_9GAMM|nr:thiol reductant ABC exporter subunit CydD [Thiorhodovibrio winogradskyi]